MKLPRIPRWFFGLKPKGWTDKDEEDYQAWAKTQPDFRSLYK